MPKKIKRDAKPAATADLVPISHSPAPSESAPETIRNSTLVIRNSSLIIPHSSLSLSDKQFHVLAAVPPEAEWFANLTNPHTRKAYAKDIRQFLGFCGIAPGDVTRLREVRRSHVIAWRRSLESEGLSPASIRRKLSALASLFDYLCDQNSIENNPVDGVARPNEGQNEGKTPALSASQARRIRDVPAEDTLIGIRDRAMLALFLHGALRIGEVAKLRVRDYTQHRGFPILRVRGKRGKTRKVELHSVAQQRLEAWLDVAGIREDLDGPLFRPVEKRRVEGLLQWKVLEKGMREEVIFERVRHYGKKAGIPVNDFSPHSFRATAITQALEEGAELSRVQAWAGHASPATTKLYDRRHLKPEDSPSFKTNY